MHVSYYVIPRIEISSACIFVCCCVIPRITSSYVCCVIPRVVYCSELLLLGCWYLQALQMVLRMAMTVSARSYQYSNPKLKGQGCWYYVLRSEAEHCLASVASGDFWKCCFYATLPVRGRLVSWVRWLAYLRGLHQQYLVPSVCT